MISFRILSLVIVVQVLTSCAHSQREWKYKNDPEASEVLSVMDLSASILGEEFSKVRKCIVSRGESPNALRLRGIMRTEKGILSIASIETDRSTRDALRKTKDCLNLPLERPKKDVASGILSRPALLKKDFIYRFEGNVFPEISGAVKADGYEDVAKF